MNIEIEKKYLVNNYSWKQNIEGVLYKQGYIFRDTEKSVRVRIAGNKAFFTIKGKRNNISRDEFEYEIPVDDAKLLLEKYCTGTLIEKVRYKIQFDGKTWEIDEFKGKNKGLVIAEIELDSEGELFSIPDWIGEEVSNDPRYYNSNLAVCPYSEWKK